MGLFGDLFDFDGDGTTDAFETALGLSIVFSIDENEKTLILVTEVVRNCAKKERFIIYANAA